MASFFLGGGGTQSKSNVKNGTFKKKNCKITDLNLLKVLGKSVGLCKSAKRKDQLYIRLLVSVLRIICENFNPNGLLLARL